MRIPISAPVFFASLVLLSAACQQADADAVGHSPNSSARSKHGTVVPGSLVHFESAEQQVAEGRYIYAATQLDKGIVAFRIETGKMSGSRAKRANCAIDVLTRLRKPLRHGEAVSVEELHRAILAAMESEPMPVSTLPKPDPELFVPVNGH